MSPSSKPAEVGNLATGGNTGKLSLLQGKVLSTLRRHHSAALVRAYVDANRDGARWLTDFADEAGVPYTRRTAYTYAQSACRRSTTSRRSSPPRTRRVSPCAGSARRVPARFPIVDAVALDDQVAIDPQAVALALARAFLAAGGTLHTGTRVTHVHGRCRAPASRRRPGSPRADQVVLATAAPITYRGFYFAKTRGLRSYCVAFDVAGRGARRPLPVGRRPDPVASAR